MRKTRFVEFSFLITLSIVFVVTQYYYWSIKSSSQNSTNLLIQESPLEEIEKVDANDELLGLPEKKFSFVVGGDMMFDRAVDFSFRGEKIYEAVAGLDGLFADRDLALINLEGPISATQIAADNSGSMNFNFPPLVPDVLVSLNINAVSLANNHTHNAGVSGLKNTLKVLRDKNITPIGDETVTNEDSVKTFLAETDKMAVIGINCLESSFDITSMIRDKKAEGYHILVYPHWGIEYEKMHAKSQERLAYSWIDAGADIVIGSHPHVVQDAERYKGRPIIYSLGNLLFDQTFSEQTQRGLVVRGEFVENKLSLNLVPIISKQIKPKPEIDPKKSEIIAELTKNLGGNLEFGAE